MKIEIVVGRLYQQKRIDAYLAEVFTGTYSREELKSALTKSAITLNGLPTRPSAMVSEGDRIDGSVTSEKGKALVPENIPIKILYEDESMFVVDKPAGMVVHPGAGNKKSTLVHALLGLGGSLSSGGGSDRPGIVHRIDKPTSGILLVAKTNEAHRKLQYQFEARTIVKVYTVLVRGRVEYDEGRVVAALGRDPKARQKRAVSRGNDAKEAETRYRVLERFRHFTLLEAQIMTGRTHQIRVHMKHIGHPVAGDALYGPRGPFTRLGLHASHVEFTHPVTDEPMTFDAEWPDDFRQMVENARSEKE